MIEPLELRSLYSVIPGTDDCIETGVYRSLILLGGIDVMAARS